MPVMDGLEATRGIRALDRGDAATVPIIAMTANTYEDDVRECLDAGMDAHVGKPVDPSVLYATLYRFLNGDM
jgi:CheY-like chemotaxis protein